MWTLYNRTTELAFRPLLNYFHPSCSSHCSSAIVALHFLIATNSLVLSRILTTLALGLWFRLCFFLRITFWKITTPWLVLASLQHHCSASRPS